MPAPALSHVILTGALIVVIFVVQVFYFNVVDNVWADMVKRELQEISDYVADTIANLYYLVNATNTSPTLEKSLSLPLDVSGSSYSIDITYDQYNVAQLVKVALLYPHSYVSVNSWLPRGLKVNTGNPPPPATRTIQSSGKTVIAGCQRVSTSVFVWLSYQG